MTKVFLVISLLLTLPTLVWAGPGSDTLRLTLPQAVAVALAANPDLTLARQRRQAATVSVEAAQGQFMPSLQASAGAEEMVRRQAAPGEANAIQTADVQLRASLNLFHGFADSAGLDRSRQQLQAANATLLRQEQSVAFTVASRYLAVLSTAELVQVAAQNLQQQQDQEQQISAFYQAGVRAVTDLYQQQAATAQAEFGLLDSRRNLQVARLELWQALGRTPAGEIELPVPAGEALTATLGEPDSAQTLAQARAARPDLQAQQRQMEAARYAIRVAQAGYLPSLDLQGGGSTVYTSAATGGSVLQQFDDNGRASLGLALSIPLFDRAQTRTGVAQARIGAADAATTLLKLQQQVEVEVGQAVADYYRARQQLSAAARQLEFARLALAAGEARYRVGAATWVELSNARTVFVQAQGDEVRARYGILLQGLNLGYVRGDLAALLKLLDTPETPS